MKKPIPESMLLNATNRTQWRAWLRKHYKSQSEIWLVYYKKHTGKPRISYNDAVEEALCFGWIDSTVRSLDPDRYAQRFSVRRARSKYSQANLERLRSLAKEGKVVKSVLDSLPDLSPSSFRIPPDILSAVRSNENAWRYFQRLPKAYVRIRVAFIDAARNRPEEFKKRLVYFVRMTAANRKFGFGGIEKHF
jgi:uncharacterized protein YdeI (YjbR/CyaY-like superfamily)